MYKYPNLSPFLLTLMSVAQQVTDAMGSDGLWNKEEQWMFAIWLIYAKETVVVLDETRGHEATHS